MPNWCSNRMHFSGEPAQIAEIKRLASGGGGSGRNRRRPALRRGDGGRSVCGGVLRRARMGVQPAGAGGVRRDRLHAAPSRAEKNRLSAREKGADGGGLRGKPAAGVVRHAERISARAEARAACAGAAGRGHAGGRDAASIQPPRRRAVSGGAHAPAGKILRFAERAARGHARRARPRRARGRPGLCAGQLADASGGI